MPQRPIITMPQSQLALVLNIITVVGVLLSLIIAIRGWFILPDVIPIHFNLSGQPNGWGSKAIIWLFPALAIIISVGLTFLSRYPRLFNYPVQITPENAARQYQIACSLLNFFKAELAWIFAYTVWLIYYLGSSSSTESGILGLPLILLVISIFTTVGFYLRQAFLYR
ncbi:DUF1648 domain-containing protein [Aerosakkonemataceae cyanobacterium BLCC-F50]|uniref:DUF1648 domain-containing protein n=1 Tax=Floridaenema flaviceps BLCC-F50 TaxID=3153642 RepID=A0ABV4XU32_9CYAN